MKRLFILGLVAITSVLSFAQKDRTSLTKVNHLSLPKSVLASSVNTYQIVISKTAIIKQLAIDPAEVSNSVRLEGLSAIDEGVAELKIKYFIAGVPAINGTQNPVTKDGVTKYYYKYTCTPKVSFEVVSGSKTVKSVKCYPFATKDQKVFTFSTATHATSSAAKSEWNKSGRTLCQNKLRAFIIAQIAESKVKLQEEVDYYDQQEHVEVLYFKSTKKASYPEYETNSNAIIESLGNVSATSDRSAYIAAVAGPKGFYEGKIAGLSAEDKEQKTFYMVCALNLAVINYWSDNMADAQKYLDMAKKVKGRVQFKEGLRIDIYDRKNALEATKANGISVYTGVGLASDVELATIRTSYLAEQASREAEIAARIDAEKQKFAPVVDDYSGFIINREGAKVTGKFKWYKKNTHHKEGQIFFIANGSDVEQILSGFTMSRAEFGEYKYQEVPYADALSREKALMRVMYESEKIVVSYFERWDKDHKYIMKDYYYFKTGAERAKCITNSDFTVAYKKKMAKYFEDCPALVTKITANEFPSSPEMYVAAAAEYSTLCK